MKTSSATNPYIAFKQALGLPRPLNIKEYERLLNDVVRVNYPDRNRMTLLHHAVLAGNLNAVTALIEKGAAKNGCDLQEQTALILAAKHCETEIALKLIEAGADIHAADDENRTAFYYACEFAQDPLAAKLIEEGAHIGRNDEQQDVLMQTLFWKYMEQSVIAITNRKSHPHYRRLCDNHKKLLRNDSHVEAMCTQFAFHILLPAYILEITGEESPERITSFIETHLTHPEEKERVMRGLEAMAERILLGPEPSFSALAHNARLSASHPFITQLFRPIRLARGWSHAAVYMPANLTPLRKKHEWHSVMPDDFSCETTYNGTALHITCLHNTAQLNAESFMLHNCLDNERYTNNACKDDDSRSHIFSVRTDQGQSIACFEVQCSQDGKTIKIMRQEGPDNLEEMSMSAHKAIEEWRKEVGSHRAPLSLKPLGETEQSKKAGIAAQYLDMGVEEMPALLHDIGHMPSWDSIHKIFNEYRMPYRRACLQSTNRQMQYDDITDATGYTHKNYFISAYPLDGAAQKHSAVSNEGNMRNTLPSLRELDARSWLRATGALEEMHILANHCMNIPDDTKQRWQVEAEEPLIYSAVPTPSHKLDAGDKQRSAELLAQDLRETAGNYFVH